MSDEFQHNFNIKLLLFFSFHEHDHSSVRPIVGARNVPVVTARRGMILQFSPPHMSALLSDPHCPSQKNVDCGIPTLFHEMGFVRRVVVSCKRVSFFLCYRSSHQILVQICSMKNVEHRSSNGWQWFVDISRHAVGWIDFHGLLMLDRRRTHFIGPLKCCALLAASHMRPSAMPLIIIANELIEMLTACHLLAFLLRK